MKLFALVAAAMVTLSVGQAFADKDCNNHSWERTREYSISNDAQKVSVDVLKAVYYVECKSTFQEMAQDLTAAQQAALDAYQDASVYSPISGVVHNRLQVLVSSLERVDRRLNQISQTAASQDSAMRLRIALARVKGLVGN